MRRVAMIPVGFVTAAAVVAAATTATGACGDAGPDLPPVGDPAGQIPEFDGAAAYSLLERQVAFGPRAPGTPGHRRQLDWMVDFLRERADTVVIQRFTHIDDDDDGEGDGGRDTLRMANVFARFLPGRTERVLLLAHWDTRPVAERDPEPDRREQPIPGANDGASGTAVLLHMADVLSSHSPPIGVDLLLVDGEDQPPGARLLGSTHFAANPPPGYRPLYGVLVDMVADRDPVFPVEGYSQDYAPSVVRRVWRTAEELGYGSLFPDRVVGPIRDDHVPLNRAGIPTIDIIDFEYGPGNRYWHTHRDELAQTAPVGLEAVGTVLTTLIFRGG
ncbi:MAG: M28 family peptidase [Gemmatimonadota bacterium]